MKIGSLFSGYGGLDMAVQSHFGGELAWYSEIEPAACKVLATLHPDVPNIGDITKVDWSQVEPVDIITGGYPCQPFSNAGLRKGKNDERHLWPYVRDALSAIRPRLAVLENVRGHITLGFGDVLADLAHMGWDAQWGIVRAAEAGAPHNRARLFILCYPHNNGFAASEAGRGIRESQEQWWAQEQESHGQLEGTSGSHSAYPNSQGLQGSPSGSGETQTKRHGHFEQGVGALATNPQHHGSLASEGRRGVRANVVQGWEQQQKGSQWESQGSSDSQPVAHSDNRHGQTVRDLQELERHVARSDMPELQPIEWGQYQPAIERWEAVIDRTAPAPTVIHKDKPRLNPAFVEWMMGLPAGHVTGHGLSAAQELKMLGNGVVPQQAALALQLLAVST